MLCCGLIWWRCGFPRWGREHRKWATYMFVTRSNGKKERKKTELVPNCWCRVHNRWFPPVLFLFFPLIQYWRVQSVLGNIGNLLGKSFKVITRLSLSNARGHIRIAGWSSEAWLSSCCTAWTPSWSWSEIFLFSFWKDPKFDEWTTLWPWIITIRWMSCE